MKTWETEVSDPQGDTVFWKKMRMKTHWSQQEGGNGVIDLFFFDNEIFLES